MLLAPLPVEYLGEAACIPDDCIAVPSLGYPTPENFGHAITIAYVWAFPNAPPIDFGIMLQSIQALKIPFNSVRPKHYHLFKVKGNNP